MARLTISLSDERHLALKEAASRRGKTIGEVIEESLERSGIKTSQEAAALVAIIRARSQLTSKSAMELALSETQKTRRRQ